MDIEEQVIDEHDLTRFIGENAEVYVLGHKLPFFGVLGNDSFGRVQLSFPDGKGAYLLRTLDEVHVRGKEFVYASVKGI